MSTMNDSAANLDKKHGLRPESRFQEILSLACLALQRENGTSTSRFIEETGKDMFLGNPDTVLVKVE